MGLSYEGKIHNLNEVEFLSDLTYKNDLNEMTAEQEIFDEVFKMIDEAEELIVLDMFLFNAYTDQDRDFPDLSGRLTKALIKQKERYPNLQIVFITDPINNGYHSYLEPHIEALQAHNIEVVLTNLSKLHDSNKPYTSVWRVLFQAFGQKGKAWLPNPFAKEAPDFTLRSYLELFNVKANHRKAVITENNAIIASANPHNESGFASNIGFKVSGEIINDMLAAEQAVLDYSGSQTRLKQPKIKETKNANIEAQYLTEKKILKRILKEIKASQKEDVIWVGMFYIANRDVIDALHDATNRGVKVNLILDSNQAAFGNKKAGLPNLPVASELIKDPGINIRWYASEEDQYHTKLLYIKKPSEGIVIGGSANYTTRNLDDLNLENNIAIKADADEEIIKEVDQYFDRLWHNKQGTFTSNYESQEDALTPMLKLTYWVQKLSGLTTY